MKLLAFDTSTETLRVGVEAHGRVFQREAPGAAQASATLLPTILDLLAQAGIAVRELDAIVFGRGPGSFTGVRTACSVAQGLAWGAGVPVLGIDTLAAVAEDARMRHGATGVVSVMDARMDEVYWAAWQHDGTSWLPVVSARLGAPETVEVPAGWIIAGNAAAPYAGRLPPAPAVEAAPSADALLRLSPGSLAAGMATSAGQAMPLYIRDKVALTTEERAAARAASRP